TATANAAASTLRAKSGSERAEARASGSSRIGTPPTWDVSTPSSDSSSATEAPGSGLEIEPPEGADASGLDAAGAREADPDAVGATDGVGATGAAPQPANKSAP